MTNAELIAELRGHILSVPLTLLHDAADALEAADEKISDCVAAIDALDDSNDAYIKENERLKKRIAEMEAQMPKEGEWIEQDNGNSIYHKCSVCGKNQYNVLLEMMQGDYHYCPNCGARMRKGERYDHQRM